MHLETWHFTAIQNKEVLKELNDKIKGAFAKSDDPHTRERGHSQTYCCYYHAPTLVIVSNELPMVGCYGLRLRLGEHFPCSQVPRIGSCWINQLGQTCDDPDVRAFLTKLGVPESHKVYAAQPWDMLPPMLR